MAHLKPLGRRAPLTDLHIRRHRLSIAQPVAHVEHTMKLPWWHWLHDQGSEGACVGHGTAMERAVREAFERRERRQRPFEVRFDSWWLWDRAKEVDGWSDTNPGDHEGTSVHAAYDIVRLRGAVRTPTYRLAGYKGAFETAKPFPDAQWSITENSWATSVDEIRTCIARNQPVTIGVNWYSGFDNPWQANDGYFVTLNGSIRGGHCVCIYGASDRRQAFRLKNSWGRSYPLVWLPYSAMERLLAEDGEACVVTDGD